MVKEVLRSLRDILSTGCFPNDTSILKSELLTSHRVKGRQFLLAYIPENSVGAEIGVFTGLFSSILAREKKIAQVTFVDPWWEAYGEFYPNWGSYTDQGRVKTRHAYATAKRRIDRAGLSNRFVEIASSYEWLERQPDSSLDWVYLDSTHSYEGTVRELGLLNSKIKTTGLIFGDDWQTDRNHRHHGVFRAVNEFLKNGDFEVVTCGLNSQWVLRRSENAAPSSAIIWTDPLLTQRVGATRDDRV